MAGTGWTTADNWAGNTDPLPPGNNVDNVPQPWQLPAAPNLGSYDPNALTDAFRNTAFDVWKPTNGDLTPKGARLSADGKSYLDPVASQNNQIAAQRALQEQTQRLLFESKTGYSDAKAQKAAKWSNVAGGIFDNFLAPMASVFGPAGASQGVGEYVKSANEAARKQQEAVDMRRKTATSNLKEVMDAMGKASPYTNQNFDNIINMLKAQSSMQEAQARAHQAMSAAQQNIAEKGVAGARQKAIEAGMVLDANKSAAEVNHINSQSDAQKQLARYNAEHAKTEGARRSVMGRKGAEHVARTNYIQQQTKTAAAQQKNLENLIKNRDLTQEQKQTMEPVKDVKDFFNKMPAEYSDSNGQSVAQKIADALKRKHAGMSDQEAYARTLALLRAKAAAAKAAEKGGGDLVLGGVEDDGED